VSAERHDHHLHLFALAAALESAACGPPAVRDRAELARALARRAPDGRGWVRGVGYHESVAGALDRDALDALRGDVPVRVQHRSGQLWMLNSAGLAALGMGSGDGRLFRADAWLRERLGAETPPSLAEVGARLSAIGVTAATDATHTNGPAELAALAAARARGELTQRLVVMGTLELSECNPPPGIAIGPLKIHLSEAALPPLEETCAAIRAAHRRGRNAAIHCATHAELAFALAAYEAAGVAEGDRLEHVHVASPICVERIAALGLTVCTSPALVRERLAGWRREAEPAEVAWLAPLEALGRAGVPLLEGSDAPFGPLDSV
jgi:predicted amidohydrolase YtcJ